MAGSVEAYYGCLRGKVWHLHALHRPEEASPAGRSPGLPDVGLEFLMPTIVWQGLPLSASCQQSAYGLSVICHIVLG